MITVVSGEVPALKLKNQQASPENRHWLPMNYFQIQLPRHSREDKTRMQKVTVRHTILYELDPTRVRVWILERPQGTESLVSVSCTVL